MRLPWPFGRRTPSDGLTSSTPEDGRDGASSPGPVPDPAGVSDVPMLAPATGAWATLPPIQRTAGDPPLVAPAAPFLAGVPGNRPLPPIVRPLGHETGPSAPAGLVVAHVSTVPSLTSRAPMPGRHVQRRATEPAGAVPDAIAWWSGFPEPGPAETPTPATIAAGGAGAAAVGAAGAGVTGAVGADVAGAAVIGQSTPIRTLAAVAPAATVTPAARPLTLSPEPVAATRRSTGSGGTPSAAGQSSGRPTTAAFAAPGAFPAGRGGAMPPARGTGPTRTVGRWAEASASGTAPPPIGLGTPSSSSQDSPGIADPGAAASPASGPGASVPPMPGAQPSPTSASRRAGLGAPLAVPPASAVAQRLPAGNLPLRAAGAGQPPADPPVPSSAGGPASSSSATSSSADPRPAARRLPVLPVARRRSDEPATAVPGSAPAPSASVGTAGTAGTASGPSSSSGAELGRHAPATVTGSPGSWAETASTHPGTSIRPTLGLRPLHTSVTAQREAGGTPPAFDDTASVPARWPSGDDLPATVRSGGSTPGGAAGADSVPLQRLADLPTPATSAATATPMPHEIVFPPRDAAPSGGRGSSFDQGGPPGIAGVQRQAAPGTIPGFPQTMPGSSGLPERAPSGLPGHALQRSGPAARGPLNLARPQGPAAAFGIAPSPLAPAVSRMVADPASPAAPPSVQASGAAPSGSAPIGGITATPIVQRVDGAAPAAPSEEGRSESELDELARALFGRISTHLRAEVIHDREAKGLTFDAF